jgi:prolyl oligopeptidase
MDPSEDGKLLAYAVQDGGTDWRTVKVMDVATGKIRSDEIKGMKYSGGVSWAKDGSGFYYSRYPLPDAKATFQNATLNHKVYFHKLGTKQAADRLVYSTPSNPKLSHYPQVSDGRALADDLHQPGRRRERPARRRPEEARLQADRDVHGPQGPVGRDR